MLWINKQYTMFVYKWTKNCKSIVSTRVLCSLIFLMPGDLELWPTLCGLKKNWNQLFSLVSSVSSLTISNAKYHWLTNEQYLDIYILMISNVTFLFLVLMFENETCKIYLPFTMFYSRSWPWITFRREIG